MTAPATPDGISPGTTPGSTEPRLVQRMPVIAAVLIFLIGAIVRLTVDFGFKGAGFDETIYRNYVLLIDKVGLFDYPRICEAYVEDQKDPATFAKLPPTRFLYIFCGWL